MIRELKAQLKRDFPGELIDKLLETYVDLRSAFFFNRYRPSELEAGRFAEIVIRMLQFVTSNTYTPLDKRLQNMDVEAKNLENLPSSRFHDSIRIHIPRVLLAIYNVRNRRDVGHVGGDINPNYPDSLFTIRCCNWVMSELMRFFYFGDLEKATELVAGLNVKTVPLVYEVSGYRKILNPKLSLAHKVLLLLYLESPNPIKVSDLQLWCEYGNAAYLRKLLRSLDVQALVIYRDDRVFITPLGGREVEGKISFGIQ